MDIIAVYCAALLTFSGKTAYLEVGVHLSSQKVLSQNGIHNLHTNLDTSNIHTYICSAKPCFPDRFHDCFHYTYRLSNFMIVIAGGTFDIKYNIPPGKFY